MKWNVKSSTRGNAVRNQQEVLSLQVLKALLHAYVLTGILLIILAFLLFKFNLSEPKVTVGIILIYVIANFWGGFKIGKYRKEKKYLWGLVVGVLYVGILLFITLGVYRTLLHDNIISTMILCMCSGTIGGMVS